jgi:hypothetical protein
MTSVTTKQEIFDALVKGVKRQKAFGASPSGGCTYLNEDTGNMCAVGLLLGKAYCKKWIIGNKFTNGGLVKDMVRLLKETNKGNDKFSLHPVLDRRNIDFLTALQDAHDNSSDKGFARFDDELRAIAKRFRLNTTVLDKAKLMELDNK